MSQDPGTPTDWDTVNTFLLTGAHFALYRFNGPGSPTDQVITQAQIGTGAGQWTRVEDWISTATPATPEDYMYVFLDPLITYFQLVETQAPAGYQLPYGQWRLTLRDTAMTNPASHAMGHGFHLQIRYIGDSTVPAFARNGDSTHDQYGVFYVGNRPLLILPMLGGTLVRDTFLLGGLLLIFGALGILTHRVRRGSLASGREM